LPFKSKIKLISIVKFSSILFFLLMLLWNFKGV
jgi:hypothetical protein